jgi:hypothetical protein
VTIPNPFRTCRRSTTRFSNFDFSSYRFADAHDQLAFRQTIAPRPGNQTTVRNNGHSNQYIDRGGSLVATGSWRGWRAASKTAARGFSRLVVRSISGGAMSRPVTAIAAVTLALGAVAGCGEPRLSPQATESATREFREHYERKEFGQLYAAAAPEFRANGSETVFIEAMQRMSQKLGTWQSAKSLGNVKVAGEDNKFLVRYQSRFSNGEATENFVWRNAGGKPVLVGYHINSRALGL